MSHLLPAGGYKRLRDLSEPGQHPVVINTEITYEASWQARDYLLCRGCEKLFDRNGEDWVLRNCAGKNAFPLHANLRVRRPALVTPEFKTFSAKRPQIDPEKIAYFAASVFWRASSHAWRTAKNTVQDAGMLGPYEESLRRYLLGQEGFPEHCVLWVLLTERNTPAALSMLAPYRGPTRAWHTYKFLFLGIGFDLFVGKAIPKDSREMCFVRGEGNPIHVSDMFGDRIVAEMGMSIGRVRNLVKR